MRRSALIAFLLVLSGCASTEFRPYEGKANVYEGRGGTKAVVDGMEVWEGEPPRKYAVLGVLKDDRHGGLIPQATLKGDMVKEARRRGGDALIDMGGSSTYTGTVSTGVGTATAYGGSAYGTGVGSSVAVRRTSNTYAVIRYLE